VTALSSSGITSVADIPDGARIGFGPAGSTSDTYFPRMMEELGVNFDRRNGGWSDLGSQLQDGLLDVIAFAAGVPVPAVSQLEVQTDVNIIEFTEEEQSTLPENWDKNSVMMWHPGAAAWFAENAGAEIPAEMIYGN